MEYGSSTACREALRQLCNGQLQTMLHCGQRAQAGSQVGSKALCNWWPCILAYCLQSPAGSGMTARGALFPSFSCPDTVPPVVAFTLVQTNGGDVARAIVDLLNVYIQRQRQSPLAAPCRAARF